MVRWGKLMTSKRAHLKTSWRRVQRPQVLQWYLGLPARLVVRPAEAPTWLSPHARPIGWLPRLLLSETAHGHDFPLWVMSRSAGPPASRPLYPRQRTSSRAWEMSAWGQLRTFQVGIFVCDLLNHIHSTVGALVVEFAANMLATGFDIFCRSAVS
jgi:hypothetical protein